VFFDNPHRVGQVRGGRISMAETQLNVHQAAHGSKETGIEWSPRQWSDGLPKTSFRFRVLSCLK
jgi:hypothetical protein